jgi:predicted O-methyltransferase YrrM
MLYTREINQALSAIAKHNFDQLKLKTLVAYGDSLDLLRLDKKWDWILHRSF